MLSWLDFNGYTILVLVFAVLVTKQIVNAISKSVLQQWGWQVYMAVGPKLGVNQAFAEYNDKRRQLWQLNKEKRAISAQDQYAKWTKLNRQCDKLNAELKQVEESISKDRATVNTLVNQAILVTLTAPVWFFRVWFRKNVLFYLPKGVLPAWVEWVMALPFFAAGSVGLTMWMQCVNSVASSALFMLKFALFEKKVARPEKPKVKVAA
ncbi:golgi to ER traffic protein 1 [Diutina catenulata]